MKTIHIEGMACPHCEARVKAILTPFDANVTVSHKDGIAKLNCDGKENEIKEAIENGGYKVTAID